VYGLGLLLAVPGVLPFQGWLEEHYRSLAVQEMAVVLSFGTLAALPGLLGLLIGAVARTRVAVHEHLGGSFLAMLGLIGSVAFLGFGAHLWARAYRIYDDWTALEARTRSGSADAAETLAARLADPSSRNKALRIASLLPVNEGRSFFASALEAHPQASREILEAWAKAYPDDPLTRTAVLGSVAKAQSAPDVASRVDAVRVLRFLRGSDTHAPLRAAAKDPSPSVRREAARAVRDAGDPALRETAETLALDADENVSREGIRCFESGALKPEAETAAALWTRILRRTRHDSIRIRVLVRLRLLAAGTPLPRETLDLLQTLSKSPDPRLSAPAQRVLRAAEGAPKAPAPPRMPAPSRVVPGIGPSMPEGVEEEPRQEGAGAR
jgi:hypothetical protein